MEQETTRKIGKYIKEKLLGRGAMGVVFLAKDPTIGRNVAIKCIHIPQGVEEEKVKEFRERFLREARAAGVMSHPNIVTVYEADEGSSSYPPFIAMEYIDGETLNKKIKKGEKISPDTLFPMLREIAAALDYAHKNGVVHRDIKPGNIIQTADNRVKLMDFGIAKVPTSELTREGQFLGTPAYMSPEQVLGKSVDPTCDLFSLGVVAYEMISNKKPFDGDDIAVVLNKIVNEEPQDLRELNPEISKEAWAIIKKLLQKKVEQRYQSAEELIADIDAYLAGALPPYAQDFVEKTVLPTKIEEEIRIQKKQPSKSMIYTVGGLVFFAFIGIMVLIFVLIKEKNRYDYRVVLPDEIKNVSPKVEERINQEPKEELKTVEAKEDKTFEPEKEVKVLKPQIEKPKTKQAVQIISPTNKQNSSKENQLEQPEKIEKKQLATLNFSFDFGGTMKGSAELSIDGKVVKEKKIEKKLFEKKEIWSEKIQVPSGKHKIKIVYRAEIAGYLGTTEEEKEFVPGKEIGLKVKIHKTKKVPIFEWSE